MSKSSAGKTVLALAFILLTAGFTEAQTIDEGGGALLAKLANEDHRVQAVAFSPDGKLLAGGYGFYDDGGVTIWDVAGRSVVASLLGRASSKAGIERVAFSDDGKLFAAASDRGDVMLWTVGSWRSHKTILVKRGGTTDLSFSPDSTKLAYASDKAAILYDLQSGKAIVIATASDVGRGFNGISFSPDSKFVIVCGNTSIQVWDVESRKTIQVLRAATVGFFGRLSPDGRHIIAGGGAIYGKKSVQIWDFHEGRKVYELNEFRNGLFALAISHSGKLFAVAGGTYGGGEGAVSLWNLDEGRELGFVSFGDYPIHGLAFSPDDSLLAAASSDGFVLLYSVERLRGPQVKKQDSTLCGEIMVEGNRAFIVPLSKVPMPMESDFDFPWKLEIANADSVAGVANSPVVLQSWAIESSAATDRARIMEFNSLLPRARPAEINSNHLIWGDVMNPGWNEGFIAKIYGDGSFVATNNSGKCLAYGHLNQLKTDFDSLKKSLVAEGFLSLPKAPLTLGADHYRTRFIELKLDGAPELRSDADSIEVLLNGGPAKKREAFLRVFNKEEPFLSSLLRAGMKLPAN
ncbi:MAG TPA: hypothetical protein VF658_19215 [Pyrinomonadaceae bacterium]|jgi:hypothetical protein